MSEQAFMEAFAPALTVEYLTADKLIASVTDGGVKLLVTGYYCAHCRDSSDGAKWCEHKEAAFGDSRFPDQYEEYAREQLALRDMVSGRIG